jgi:hypothetical protein
MTSRRPVSPCEQTYDPVHVPARVGAPCALSQEIAVSMAMTVITITITKILKILRRVFGPAVRGCWMLPISVWLLLRRVLLGRVLLRLRLRVLRLALTCELVLLFRVNAGDATSAATEDV